jgi:hypothetical protein
MKAMESLVVPHHVRLARHIVAITHQAIREWAYLRGSERDEAIDGWEMEILKACQNTLSGSDQLIRELWGMAIERKALELPAPQFFANAEVNHVNNDPRDNAIGNLEIRQAAREMRGIAVCPHCGLPKMNCDCGAEGDKGTAQHEVVGDKGPAQQQAKGSDDGTAA